MCVFSLFGHAFNETWLLCFGAVQMTSALMFGFLKQYLCVYDAMFFKKKKSHLKGDKIMFCKQLLLLYWK